MRFAVIADVHGNALALEAVLADIDGQGIRDILNLGDHLSGPLEAARTADLLMARNLPSVAGNHDRYLIDRPVGDMHDWETDAYRQLSPAHLDWLRGQPFSLAWRDVAYLCHATPADDNRYWLQTVSPDGIVHAAAYDAIAGLAQAIPLPVLLCGHSHLPGTVRLDDGRLIVNPGSVGCPAYDDDLPVYHRVETGSPFASYAIVGEGAAGWEATFRLVGYDHLAMARLAAERGRHDWARALSTGRL
jgi:predicted phosphodiesterase